MIVLANVMDSIAAALRANQADMQVYAFPASRVTAPCYVVGYPEDLDFQFVMGNGADRAIFPVYGLVGKADDLNSRNKLSAMVADQAVGVRQVLDGNLGGQVQSSSVNDLKIETVSVAGIDYLSATFRVEVIA